MLKPCSVEKSVGIDNSLTALNPNILVILGGAPLYCGLRVCGLLGWKCTRGERGRRNVNPCRPYTFVQLYICYITCFIGYHRNSTLNYTHVLWAYGHEVFQYDEIFCLKNADAYQYFLLKKKKIILMIKFFESYQRSNFFFLLPNLEIMTVLLL